MQNKNYKWSWTVDQRAIHESGLNIDIIDFSILVMLVHFSASEGCQRMTESGTVFYMFRWKLVKQQFPTMKLNTRQSVNKRMKKLIAAKLIAPHLENQSNRCSWYRFAENKEMLFSGKCKQKLPTSNESYEQVTTKVTKTSNESLHYNNTNISTTIKKQKAASSNAPLFDEPINLVLKKYLDPSSFLLRLPGQPSAKVLDRWLKIYNEAYLLKSFLKAESYFENKKNSAKKIKSLSRTLNEWLKKEWIEDQSERDVFQVFAVWWNSKNDLPLQFDFYHTSKDRIELALYTDAMALSAQSSTRSLQYVLDNLPSFWIGRKLSTILKNFISIKNSIETRKEPKNKESANVDSMAWVTASQN